MPAFTQSRYHENADGMDGWMMDIGMEESTNREGIPRHCWTGMGEIFSLATLWYLLNFALNVCVTSKNKYIKLQGLISPKQNRKPLLKDWKLA